MDDARLDELAQSIRANGIIQPILVRRTGATYRIIAGERRWRAAQRAGLLKVPVVVRDVAEGADQQLLELALIENIQRENLNPIDEALAYQRLADEFGADAGADRRRGRQGPQLGGQLHAPAEAAGGSARRAGVGRAVDGPCPGDSRPRRCRGAAARGARGHLARPVGSRHRVARQETGGPRSRREGREPGTGNPTGSGKPDCGTGQRRAHPGRRGPHAFRPRHESAHRPPRRRAGRSRSTSAPKPS